MEWTGLEGEFDNSEALADVARTTIPPRFALQHGCSRFATEMLRVDYGLPASRLFRYWYTEDEVEDAMWSFERFSGFVLAAASRWREGRGVPDQLAWDLILHVLARAEGAEDRYFTWDDAIMFYYYYSRRKPVSPEAWREGWTGYTGVLQEMVAEAPTLGVERLQRKLSFDIHVAIPTFIWHDPRLREQMLATAWDLAARHGCKIAPSPPKAVAPGTSWRGWAGTLVRQYRDLTN